MKSKLVLVLHSHIPYVKGKGRWPFGEVWLFEAMAETYIPLLTMLHRLDNEGVASRLSLSFTPTLLEQLRDDYIREGFVDYLREKEFLATRDYRSYRAQGKREMAGLAEYYAGFYRQVMRDFKTELDGDLIGYTDHLRRQGIIEVLATAATHAYLPLLKDDKSLALQISLGRDAYVCCFKDNPRGFWLPECGYSEGLATVLAENGVRYFFVDSHGLEGGRPHGVSSYPLSQIQTTETFSARTGLTTYQVYRIKDSSIVVFGRNALLSNQVWSSDYGYPGDPVYREFHRSAPESGLKYWQVTDRFGPAGKKELYDPVLARAKTAEHAAHFVRVLGDTAWEASKLGFEEPMLVACYDTELFGHWWWEGLLWLEELLRLLDDSPCQLTLPGEAAAVPDRLPEARVLESSWGMGGKHWGWYNEETEWMWETIQDATSQIKNLPCVENGVAGDAYRQAWRELLLMQSSDWFFMVTSNHTRDYAVARFLEHYARLTRLCETLRARDFSAEFTSWLESISKEDSLFTDPAIMADRRNTVCN